jgi:NarL family two-component system response regulator LiaR
MTPKPIRVLIVDDHEIVRQGIRAILSESEDIEVVAEASDGLAAIQQVKHTKPDVILMDLIMSNMDGVEAIRRITNQQPEVRILVITTYSGDDMVFPAIKAGAHGYLLKDAGAGQLVEAIHQVHKGEPWLHPDIARKLMQEISQPKPANPTPDPLTPREVEVLGLLAKGLENHEIADQLVIAEVTVRSHISRILDKLHLANRVQATLYAMRYGLVDMEEDH